MQPAELSSVAHDNDFEQLQAPWAAGALSAAQQQALAHALGIGALAWDHIQQSWVRHRLRGPSLAGVPAVLITTLHSGALCVVRFGCHIPSTASTSGSSSTACQILDRRRPC